MKKGRIITGITWFVYMVVMMVISLIKTICIIFDSDYIKDSTFVYLSIGMFYLTIITVLSQWKNEQQ